MGSMMIMVPERCECGSVNFKVFGLVYGGSHRFVDVRCMRCGRKVFNYKEES